MYCFTVGRQKHDHAAAVYQSTAAPKTSAPDSEPDVLQCFVAMLWLNLSGFRQTRVNVQHAGKPDGYWVLCTPAKTSKHRLKESEIIQSQLCYHYTTRQSVIIEE
jgi:hypothetical protein